MNKLITFIIPAYNAEETIVAALDSFSFQYSNFFNILIIDDGSKKPLRPYVERYLKEYKNIKLIRQKNLNWGGAINNSFKYINSKYIKILDADDQLIKESFKPYLDELLELSKKNIDVILTSIDIHKIKSDKSHIHSINLKDKVMIFNDNKVFHSSKLITHHYLTLKTVLLKSFIPLLTKQAYTDNLFMYQVWLHSKTVALLSKRLCLYQYNIGRDNQSFAPKQINGSQKLLENVLLEMLQYKMIGHISEKKAKLLAKNIKNLFYWIVALKAINNDYKFSITKFIFKYLSLIENSNIDPLIKKYVIHGKYMRLIKYLDKNLLVLINKLVINTSKRGFISILSSFDKE